MKFIFLVTFGNIQFCIDLKFYKSYKIWMKRHNTIYQYIKTISLINEKIKLIIFQKKLKNRLKKDKSIMDE